MNKMVHWETTINKRVFPSPELLGLEAKASKRASVAAQKKEVMMMQRTKGNFGGSC